MDLYFILNTGSYLINGFSVFHFSPLSDWYANSTLSSTRAWDSLIEGSIMPSTAITYEFFWVQVSQLEKLQYHLHTLNKVHHHPTHQLTSCWKPLPHPCHVNQWQLHPPRNFRPLLLEVPCHIYLPSQLQHYGILHIINWHPGVHLILSNLNTIQYNMSNNNSKPISTILQLFQC